MSSIALFTLGASAASQLARSAAGAASQGLSFLAELTRPAAEEVTASKPAEPAGDQARINSFIETLKRELAAAGVELAEPLELIGDGEGGIAIQPDHPQRNVIEDLLSRDAFLQHDMRELLAENPQLSINIPAGSEPRITRI